MRLITAAAVGALHALVIVSAVAHAAPSGAIVTPGAGNVALLADDESDPPPPDRDPTPPTPTSTPTTSPEQPQRQADSDSSTSVALTPEQRTRARAAENSCIGARAVGSLAAGCQGTTVSAPAAAAPEGGPVAPRVTVTQVRERAVDKITLTKPDIEASPCLAATGRCTGTVGVPVWLWV